MDIFRDFLGGDSSSAEYMRDALGVAHEDAEEKFHEEESIVLDLTDDTDDDDLSDDIDDDDDDLNDDIDDDDDDDDDLSDDIDDDDDDLSNDIDDDDDDLNDVIDDDDDDDLSDIEDDNMDDDAAVLSVSDEAINDLLAKASDVERPQGGFTSHMISFGGAKLCATRHGCTGATNCDYAYGAPVGR